MHWSRSFAVLFVLAAAPAAAQTYPPYPQPQQPEPYYGLVSPREVMRTVTSLGLQPVSEPRLRGAVWVVRGAGREGTIVRVVVDSHTGHVVDMHAVRGAYMGPDEPGSYRPDPRYVLRDEDYPADPRAYPAPRPGEAYDSPPYAPRGAAVPDDEDDYDGPRMTPPGYVPHSSYPASSNPASPQSEPRVSSKPDTTKPETTRLASKPPVPKARPGDIKAGTKLEAVKKEEAKPKPAEAKKEEPKPKPEEAKKEEPRQETPNREEARREEEQKGDVKKEEPKQQQAKAPLTSPKSPETTGSIPAHKPAPAQPPAAPQQPKQPDLPPAQPLE